MRSIAQRIPRLRSGRRPLLRWITSDIAVAEMPAAGNWASLYEEGAGTALDLRIVDEGGGREDHLPPGFTLRWFPVEDGGAPPVHELVEVSDWLIAQIAAGSRIAISCREGRGRSTLLACAALVRLGYSLEVAYRVVGRGQPRMAWSDRQIRVLEEFSRQ